MPDTNDEQTPFNNFLNAITSSTTPDEQLFLTACAFELARRVKDDDSLPALAALLLELPPRSFYAVQFSLTTAALSSATKQRVLAAGVKPEDVTQVTLTALGLFVTLTQGNVDPIDEKAFYDVLDTVAKDAAENGVPPPFDGLIPFQDVKQPPEIFQDVHVARVFEPVILTRDTIPMYVTYRQSRGENNFGPELRGIAFLSDDDMSEILLETGEYVLAETSFLRAITADKVLPDIPRALLLSTVVAAPALHANGLISNEQLEFVNAGGLGKTTKPHHCVVADPTALPPLRAIFDTFASSGTLGVTGPSGATARFPVPGTNMEIVIDARHSQTGAYAVSRLVRRQDHTDVVLMRHETLRQLTPYGVYLFPTADHGLISLVAIS